MERLTKLVGRPKKSITLTIFLFLSSTSRAFYGSRRRDSSACGTPISLTIGLGGLYDPQCQELTNFSGVT